MKTSKLYAWHWLKSRSTLRDDSKVKTGIWLKFNNDLKLCESGLHASENILHSLQFAPGSWLCRVEIAGKVIKGDDKLVASQRKILWQFNAEDCLREFSRWCALQVIHLWNAPKIVKDYLETGDPKLRSAAWSAARSATWSAARSAARSAAESAAESAAWSAAESAAWFARSAAESAAESAARSARSAAEFAAESAAWSAAWSAQEKKLLQLISKHSKKKMYV